MALGSDIAIPVWDNLAFDLWMQLIASYADAGGGENNHKQF